MERQGTPGAHKPSSHLTTFEVIDRDGTGKPNDTAPPFELALWLNL
jgi:hypothetical protein